MTSDDIKRLLQYYRSCYRADNRSGSIFNFFSSSIQFRMFNEEKEDVLSGFYPYLPADQKKLNELQKNLQVWGKEKECVYCSLFICGKTEAGNAHRRYMFSPLLIYPAKVVSHNDMLYLQPDTEEMRVNQSALSSIFEENPDNDKSELY